VPSFQNSRRIRAEPQWRPIGQYTTAQLPASFRPWLLDDGSLTLRLINLGTGKFRVRRLFQGWQIPLPSERKLLDVPPKQRALVREVALLLDEQTVVFARSVFPITSLTGDLAHLRYLQNKSLGAILFKNPGMRRSAFELAHVPGDSDYLPDELHQSAPAWCRRSRFRVSGKNLLVSEVFLQSFTPWPSSGAVHRSQRGKVSAAIMRPTQ
jgi:chorismate lyase